MADSLVSRVKAVAQSERNGRQSYGTIEMPLEAEADSAAASAASFEAASTARTEELVFKLQCAYTLYGISVCWGSYMPLWEHEDLKFSASMVGKMQAGISVCTMISAPFFCATLDLMPGRSAECFALLIFVAKGALHTSYLLLPGLVENHLTAVVACILLTETLRGACSALNDTITVARLGRDKHMFGRPRAMLAIMWGVGAAIIGAVQPQPLGLIFLLSPIFTILFIAAYYALLSSPNPMSPHHSGSLLAAKPSSDEPFQTRLVRFVRESDKPKMLELIVVFFILGASMRALETFVFLLIQQLPGGSTRLMGLATLTQTLSEIPAYWWFSSVSTKLGTRGVMYLCAVCYVVRALVYARATVGWVVLFVEPLHGVTAALLLSNVIVMVADISPEQLTGTAQGLLVRGVFNGLGGIAGSVFGGVLFDHSPSALFYGIAALGVAVVCLLAVVDAVRWWRVSGEQSFNDN